MKKEIDFKVKGTKLPMIPKGASKSNLGTSDNSFDTSGKDYPNLFSYGVSTRHNVVCILAEVEYYSGCYHWEIPLSDILIFAKEQGMIENRKIIGYLVPVDMPSIEAKKR